jgi:formylmethanofuran dehydrogenase subunit C
MKNPFEEFGNYYVPPKRIPLDDIIASKDLVKDRLMRAYETIMEGEAERLVWIMNRDNLSAAYSKAEEVVKAIAYRPEDIEEFCYELDHAERIYHQITGPPSIFISALCNNAQENEIILKLSEMRRRVDMLGYKLPSGKQLIVESDTGNLAGCGMEGGRLIIQGNTGNYTGAWMTDGKITIQGNAGYHTGEGMRDGEIRVAGRVRSLGSIRHGRVYQGEKLIYPDYSPHRPG